MSRRRSVAIVTPPCPTAINDSAPTPLAPGRFLKLKEVSAQTSLHAATIYRRIVAGTFPSPRPIGGGRVVWLEREIEEWKLRILAEPPD